MGQQEREKPNAEKVQGDGMKHVPTPDFGGFITGLYTQTLFAMGLVQDPRTEEKKTDLEEARFLIDTIGMLEKKTQGNLTEEENNYLHQILNDLRVRYVNAAREESNTCEEHEENA